MPSRPPLVIVTLLIGLAVAAGASRASAAGMQGQAAPAKPASPTTVGARATLPVRVERLIDRVWVVEASTTVAAGSLYVFLADNVLVISPKGGTPSVGTWAEDVEGLVITEKGRSSKVDVLELTAERLHLRVKGPRAAADITLAPAIPPEPPRPQPEPTTTTAAGSASPAAPAPAPSPVVAPGGAPYRCGGDTFRVAFEGDKAYLTWPDNTVVVLNETRVADAPASRRTYSDGQIRVVEDTSETFTRVLFARPGCRPRPCTSTR